jgi:hypothetical protein
VLTSTLILQSVALKSSFTEQIRSSGIIAAEFMPAVLRALGMDDNNVHLDLSQWSVDDFDFKGVPQ